MKKTFAILALFVSFCTQAQTPEDALQKISKYPQERIFVQLDKGEYLAGETVHFKAYVFSRLQLSRISTNLYFECLDRNKKAVYQNTFPIATGVADGSFTLPQNLAENIYYIRAYTNWMLNFEEKIQFLQPLAVYNPSSPNKLVQQATAWEASAHPEGGILLDNTESQVAVRLHSIGDLPAHWSGYLFDKTDSTKKLMEFTSLNEEVALFSFTPVFGKEYSIKITDEDKHTQTITLPTVAKEGVLLQTANLSRGIAYRLTAKGLEQHLQNFKIVASRQSDLLYSAVVKSDKDVISGIIPIDSITRGLVYVTLFDAAGNVAAERICFANLPQAFAKQPQIDFARVASVYRGINEWKMQVDTLRPDAYMVGVVTASTPAFTTNDFLSHFWLSELSTIPQNGGWYFDKTNKEAANALDAFLISEKWRLFDWKKILSGSSLKLKYYPDNFISYQGTVTRKSKPVPKDDVTLLLQLKDSSRILVNVRTDSTGTFRIRNLIFRDSAKVFFHETANRFNPIKIDVDLNRVEYFKPYGPSLPATTFTLVARKAGDTLPQHVKNYATALKNLEAIDQRSKMMEAVVIKTKSKTATEQLNKKLSSPMFRESGELLFDFMNEEMDASGSVFDWLVGKAPGFYTSVNQTGQTVGIMRNREVKIYVDEWLADGERLNAIPLTDIAMVKVLRNSYLLGAGSPVVAVYTKRADMYENSNGPSQKIPTKTVTGYPVVQEVKMPDYDNGFASSVQNDTRSVLYWNTMLNPINNQVMIKFYNNDISKRVRLVAMGIDNDGLPVYINKEIAF